MPRIAPWDNLPPNVRQHLIDRMRDRAISLADLNLVSGLRPSQKCPKGSGIRISAHSRSAAMALTPRRFFFPVSLPRPKPFNTKPSMSIIWASARHETILFQSCKYPIGVVPSCLRNIDMNALGLR